MSFKISFIHPLTTSYMYTIYLNHIHSRTLLSVSQHASLPPHVYLPTPTPHSCVSNPLSPVSSACWHAGWVLAHLLASSYVGNPSCRVHERSGHAVPSRRHSQPPPCPPARTFFQLHPFCPPAFLWRPGRLLDTDVPFRAGHLPGTSQHPAHFWVCSFVAAHCRKPSFWPGPRQHWSWG